ncbi:DUF2076 domain-containing protein [Undibacterium sp. TJN25]|uniref:DUF2076 domain-containing protein n=1 Tax=Undibacterium sp. TJN25 TaxID=3413056 RepID=UPI003BF125D9
MSPQETQVLQQFLDQLIEVKGISKDADAQAMIAQAVSRQPDAAYLLVQRALLLDQAVANAQNQIAQLQTEVSDLRAAATRPERSGFLDASGAWGNSALNRPSAPVPAFTPVLNNPPPAYGYPAPAQTMAAPQQGFFGGNGGSMLGTVAATAAGVAAGAFLFQGIGSLMGHHASGNSQALDSGGSAAAPAGSGGDGLISNYFTDDPVAQSDAGNSDGLDSFDDGDTA